MIAQLYDCFKHWSEKGSVWIVSDTHFSDEDVHKANPDRPSDEELVKIINSKVGKNDTLIHLGDVGDLSYAKKLKGHKVLIMGNHDAGSSLYKGVFDEVYAGPLMVGEKLILSHEPLNIDFAFNIHGHNHSKKSRNDSRHFNVCSDACDNYMPFSLGVMLKEGLVAHIQSYHRSTIDSATERKRKRKEKK